MHVLSVHLSFLLFTMAEANSSAGQSDTEPLTKKIDRLFAEWDKWDSPGAALAIIKDGSIIYKRGYGSANLEYNIAITPSTVFHVASVSKQFTAFAITLLAQKGKLSLDDDIRKHLSEVHDFGKTITIRHLIYHTSGLRDQWELLIMSGFRLDDVITKEHIMKLVQHQKELNFDPGEEHLYCNTGYTLLAEIVERISGQSFRQYAEDNIFKPLGMSNTHFHDDHEMIVKNRAYSYEPDEDSGFKKKVLSFANVGATSLFTTVEDLAKWVQNFADGRVGGIAAIEQMHERGVLNNGKMIAYAFGLNIGGHKGLKTVSHGGSDAGYRTHLVLFPDQKIAVTVLSNLSTFNPAGLAMQVAEIYLADEIVSEETQAETDEPETIKVDTTIYDDYVGKYFISSESVTITITKENDRLMGEATGKTKSELVPESETKYFMKDAPISVSFQREETGEVTQLTVYMDGRELTAKRIESPIPENLEEFVGDYYSHELDTTYTIIVKDNQLVVQHRRNIDVSLNPTVADEFIGGEWWVRQVHFIRDDENRIAGFRLTGGRVRNLRFLRRQ